MRLPADHFLNDQISSVSASSKVFCNHVIFSLLMQFFRSLSDLLSALLVVCEIVLVSAISCLALVFQALVFVSALLIVVFHHGLACSEGRDGFAVFWVASVSAAWRAIAAFLACV